MCDSESPNVDELSELVRVHLCDLRSAADADPFLPVDLAENLASAVLDLLDDSTLTGGARRLVVGLARYFVSNEDDYPDIGEIFGLDDDLAIYNHVVSQLGRTELCIAE